MKFILMTVTERRINSILYQNMGGTAGHFHKFLFVSKLGPDLEKGQLLWVGMTSLQMSEVQGFFSKFAGHFKVKYKKSESEIGVLHETLNQI